jgi:hypothetical protein
MQQQMINIPALNIFNTHNMSVGTILAERERERERDEQTYIKDVRTRANIVKIRFLNTTFVYKYIYGTGKCMPLLRRFCINDYPESHLFMKNSLPME